jgi:hypothetical protein
MSEGVQVALISAVGAIIGGLLGALAQIIAARIESQARQRETSGIDKQSGRAPAYRPSDKEKDRAVDLRKYAPLVMLVAGSIIGLVIGLSVAKGPWAPPEGDLTSSPRSPGLILYDSFDKPNYNEVLSAALWQYGAGERCNAVLQQGELSFSDYNDCLLIVRHSSEISFGNLRVFEARLKLSSQYNQQGATGIGIRFSTDDLPGNLWWASCGLTATGDGINGNIDVTNYGAGDRKDIALNIPAEYDQWYTFHLEADPTTTRISCYVDGTLIGSGIPSDSADLPSALFQLDVNAWAYDGATSTSYIDDVYVWSGEP